MSDPNVKTFLGAARFNDKGEMVCFCYETDVKANRCDCKKKYDLPEVQITVEPILGTRPSEQSPAARVAKSAESQLKKLARESNEIKKGLQNLEKAAKGLRFRI